MFSYGCTGHGDHRLLYVQAGKMVQERGTCTCTTVMVLVGFIQVGSDVTCGKFCESLSCFYIAIIITVAVQTPAANTDAVFSGWPEPISVSIKR